MKITAKQMEFITLRAENISFDKISKQLKISKTTLIQWSKLYEDNIKELQFYAMVEVKKQFSHSIKSRYEILLKQLDKIDNAILNADLNEESLKDLIQLQQHTSTQIEIIENKISINAYVTKTNELGYKENLKLKLNEI